MKPRYLLSRGNIYGCVNGARRPGKRKNSDGCIAHLSSNQSREDIIAAPQSLSHPLPALYNFYSSFSVLLLYQGTFYSL
ncbi:hypothetical protein INR49_031389 [Caranx melampygus]|nr:hypothetical protein INR49_031456 [Caranx melampygus]KAG7238035.1 hypothetical protein INR49_031389 [Caranx melampygus]